MNKKTAIFFYLLLASVSMSGQSVPEPFASRYRAAKTNQEKGSLLLGSPDTFKSITPEALNKWFTAHNDEVGADYTNVALAMNTFFKGDNAIALDMTFPLLKHFEKRSDEYGIMRCYHIIGLAYSQVKKFDLACTYIRKSILIAETLRLNKFLTTLYNDIGVVYSMAELPDRGLEYAQKSLKFAEKYNPGYRATALSTVGENYLAAKEYDIALPFLRRSRKLDEGKNSYGYGYTDNDFAQTFLGMKKYDSAVYYAERSLRTSKKFGYKDQILRSYEYMVAVFEQTQKPDSLNKYYKLLLRSKDEMFSFEKLHSVEASNYREQLRQSALKAKAAADECQRRTNIQYALIAAGIITFFIFFLMLSRTIIVNEKWISFLAILALLLVFEFINLLIHPFLETVTEHSPILMLLFLVALASLLIPVHHRLEDFFKNKLTEKNKVIRLASAKRTIAKLDKDHENKT